MLIHDLACARDGRRRVLSAAVVWEEQDFPTQRLTFDIGGPQSDGACTEYGADPLLSDDPTPDAFLAACFPLAAVHGEARIRVEGRACPMLVEGLRTAYAWWSSWGGMPSPAPRIESAARGRFARPNVPRRAVALLSGGVDSLHMLMRNHQLYDPDDAAYIRDAIFIHGIDIGKRPRDPGTERYRAVLRRLEPVALETGMKSYPLPNQSAASAFTSGILGKPPQRRGAGCCRACSDSSPGLFVHWRDIPGRYPRSGRLSSDSRWTFLNPAPGGDT